VSDLDRRLAGGPADVDEDGVAGDEGGGGERAAQFPTEDGTGSVRR